MNANYLICFINAFYNQITPIFYVELPLVHYVNFDRDMNAIDCFYLCTPLINNNYLNAYVCNYANFSQALSLENVFHRT